MLFRNATRTIAAGAVIIAVALSACTPGQSVDHGERRDIR